jgi:hypothetical protein
MILANTALSLRVLIIDCALPIDHAFFRVLPLVHDLTSEREQSHHEPVAVVVDDGSNSEL